MTITNVVTDAFGRSVSTWTTADTGQTYSFTGAGGTVSASTDSSVSSGSAKHSVPAANAYRMDYLAALSLSDVDVQVTVSIAALPTGAPLEVGNIALRATSTSAYYLMRAQVETSGAVTALIFDRSGAQLASATVPGITYSGGMQLTVRAQAVGTTLRLRVWQTSVAQPPRWLLSVVDSAYTGGGWPGIRSGAAVGNTNTKPVVFTIDNLTIGVPSSPAFPDADLDVRVLAAFGADLKANPYTWTYADLSTDLLEDPIQLKHGRSDGSGSAEPATFSCALDNPDGRYTKGHPLSTHWPYVRKNTPILFLINPDTSPTPVQFDGFAVGWTPTWSVWAQKPAVTLTAGGILQRLKQGLNPPRSALYRALLAAQPFAYWPLEDGPAADRAASVAGGSAVSLVRLSATGPAEFGAVTPPTGAAVMPSFIRGGAFILPVGSSVASAWTIELACFFGTGEPSPNDYDIPFALNIFRAIAPNGDYWEVQLSPHNTQNTNGRVALFRSDLDEEANFDTLVDSALGSFNPWDGLTHHIAVAAAHSGSDINWKFFLDGAVYASGTLASRTLQPVHHILINENGFLASSSVYGLGHVAFFESVIDPVPHASAAAGWQGETATARLARLAAEEGIPLSITGSSDAAMGAQSVAAELALMQECEDVDGGQLFDGLVAAGASYVARTARYNLPSKMTIDYKALRVNGQTSDEQVLVPADDDQLLRNQWTMSRQNGSTVTVTDDDGPQGVNAVDLYNSSATVNVASDAQLPDLGAWRVAQGTVDGLRYPSVSVDLDANPALLTTWLGVGLLDRITETNLPPQHPPFDVDLVVVGRRQTISRRAWAATANCAAFEPWRVPALGLLSTSGTHDANEVLWILAATNSSITGGPVAIGATSFSVATPAGNLWTTTATYPTDFPRYVNVAGIRIKVTGISGTTSPQAFTVDPSTVIKVLPNGSAVDVWDPPGLGL